MARREKKEEWATRNTENPFYRKGTIYKIYGRWNEFIEKLSDLVIPSKEGLLFQDVMPDRRDQALIFRMIKVFGFPGGGLEFLAWMSLARVVADLEAVFVGKTSLEALQIIIAKERELDKDLVNILYLYSKDGGLFYEYLDFEIERKAFPFKPKLERDEENLMEFAKLSAMIAAFKGIFFWEIRTGQKHPGRAFLQQLSVVIAG